MIGLYISAFALALLEMLGLSIYSTLTVSGWFNPAVFGSGFATIIGATGAVHICHGRWGSPPTPPGGQ